MNKTILYSLPALAFAMAACADGYEGDFQMEKPESVEHAEHLASLATLNSVIDRNANPNFKLGLAVSSADYSSRELTYSIALTNFDVVTDASVLAYASLLNEDGGYVFTPVTDMFISDSPRVTGGSMLSYNAVPTAHLQQVISPTFVKGDLQTGMLGVADFDDEEIGNSYPMNNGSTATVTVNPAGNEGHVLQIGSPGSKARNSYAVFSLSLPDGLNVGNLTYVMLDLYCPDNNTQKRNFVAIVNGVRKNYTGDTPEKRGCPLNTWMNKMTIDITDMGLTEEQKKATELEICFGPNVNNSYYFIDNVSLGWTTGVADAYVEKNEAEKAEALAGDFSEWAKNVMTACAADMSDFTVLSSPMSDTAPYALRTAASEAADGIDVSGCFFFNDYMGDNYLKTVTDCLLKEYKESAQSSDARFYVAESGLLGNVAKTSSFLNQISSWTLAGAKIDGLAVNLGKIQPSADNRVAVTQLFQALSGSGKLIRLDNLSVAGADAGFYEFLVSEYFRLIKAENRAGIIFAGTSDLWKNNARTDAYEAVLKALSAK